MTLMELQEVLGERIEVTLDNTVSEKERVAENKRSEMVVAIAKQMINNATVVLRAEDLMAKNKITKQSSISILAGEER